MRAIVRWSVDNPVAVNLLFLLIVGAGLAAFVSMPREVMPAINLDQVRIETRYPGGTAEEVERLVTARIEEAIENVPGVGETRSLSRPGFSEVVVDVSFGEDVDTVARRIEVEVRRIRELPEEVDEDPVVQVQRAEFPVIVVNVWGAADQGQVRLWIERLRREILQFHGVASVIADDTGLSYP